MAVDEASSGVVDIMWRNSTMFYGDKESRGKIGKRKKVEKGGQWIRERKGSRDLANWGWTWV